MSTPRPRPALLFDLDGTLVDSEPLYHEAGRRVLAAHGVADFPWEEHLRFLGIATSDTMATLRREHGLAAPVERLVAEKNRAYLELSAHRARAFPEMRRFLALARSAGLPVAVASGSSRRAIDTVLAATGLSAALPVRVSAEEVPHGKPAPDVFLAAAERLGVAADRCVVVEDAPPGAEAARRAGMRCVAVPYLASLADDPGFAGAGLRFPGGQAAFDACAALEWVLADDVAR